MQKNTIRIGRPILRQAGNTILGAAFGVAAMLVIGSGATVAYNNYKIDQVAQARGQQIGTGLVELERYARKYQTQLSAGQAITGVLTSTSPTNTELTNLGYAMAGFDDATQPGGKLSFQVNKEPAGCVAAKCILGLKVVTSGSVKKNGVISLEFAQRVAGYVPRGAGWSNLASDPGKISKNGQSLPNPLGTVPAIVVAASWLGSSQASQVVPPVSYEYQSGSCAAGQTGSKEYSRSVTTDKWGTVTRSSWQLDSNDCADPPPPPPPPPAPTCSNGASDYPTCTPPAAPTCANGATNYPTCTAASSGGTCSNGASNYPTCTPPATGTCSNGASNYPTCTPPTCSNGGTNYPTCTPPTCANGASNYPSCTLFPSPPAPAPVMVNCPVSVIVRFTSTKQNSLCWNERTVPEPPQVPQGQACTYGPPEILNYGVRGGLVNNGNGCQFN